MKNTIHTFLLKTPQILFPGEDLAPHVKLMISARQKRGFIARFLARRLQSHWQLLYKLPKVLRKKLERPSQLFLKSDSGKVHSCFIPSLEATFRNYYAPRTKGIVDPEIIFLMRLLTPANGVLYDIGANWGFHGFATAIHHPKLHIHAFEANPDIAAMATRLSKELQLAEQVTVHSYGLSNENTVATLGGFGRTGDTSTGQIGAKNGVHTHLKKLDDLKIPTPNFIKLDVEGHELSVLKGAEKTIKTAKPLVLFESWGIKIDPTIDQTFPVLKWFENHNYDLWTCTWKEETPKTGHLQLTPVTITQRQKIPQLVNILAIPHTKVAQTFALLEKAVSAH